MSATINIEFFTSYFYRPSQNPSQDVECSDDDIPEGETSRETWTDQENQEDDPNDWVDCSEHLNGWNNKNVETAWCGNTCCDKWNNRSGNDDNCCSNRLSSLDEEEKGEIAEEDQQKDNHDCSNVRYYSFGIIHL